jgi:hypothetical protein
MERPQRGKKGTTSFPGVPIMKREGCIMGNGSAAGKSALVIRYAGPKPAATARKEEQAAYRNLSAAAEHLLRGCARPAAPGSRQQRPEAEVVACVDAYLDDSYQPQHPLSRKGRKVVIDAGIFGRLSEMRLKAKRERELALAEQNWKPRDQAEEGVLKDAMECALLRSDLPPLFPGMLGDTKLMMACFKRRHLPMPKQAGECIDFKGIKLYKSWYGYDYSSQYARLQACRGQQGGVTSEYRYVRAPVPAVLGAIGSGVLKDVFLKLSLGAVATRIVPVGLTLRGLAVLAALAGGWFTGKAIDEGVGCLTSAKLSDHIGLSLGEKAPAPRWMISAYDWVAHLF